MVSKDSILCHTFITDLLADESLDSSKIEDIWTECVGKNIVNGIDVDIFVKFWYAVDDLFARANNEGDGNNFWRPEEEEEDDVIKEVWPNQLAKQRYYSNNTSTTEIQGSRNEELWHSCC